MGLDRVKIKNTVKQGITVSQRIDELIVLIIN